MRAYALDDSSSRTSNDPGIPLRDPASRDDDRARMHPMTGDTECFEIPEVVRAIE